MNNKIVNKQIPMQKIIDIANYLEDYKEKYDEIFKKEKEKNKNLAFSDRNYEYENGNAEVRYTITFHNGQRITESDYNWFIGNLSNTRAIKEIEIYLSVTYYTKGQNEDYNNQYNKVYVSVDFRDAGMNLKHSDTEINVETTNQEREANNIYSTIMNTLEDTEDRYNNTMKHRKIRTQCFTISVGIILSYILYVILKININQIPPVLTEYLNNKYVLVFGQWFVAILLGNIFSYWYIISIYKPLLPETKYAGYDSTTYKSKYKDDIEDYIEHSEVHFGKFWDAEKRRTQIEKIYKVTRIIVLVQLLISVILFFILK